MTSPYLTPAEAITYLRLPSRAALYRLIHQHDLPYGRRGGVYVFHQRRLDDWLTRHEPSLTLARRA